MTLKRTELKRGGPLKRKTPLKSVSATRKPADPKREGSCHRTKCGRAGIAGGYCKPHAMNRADELFSKHIRARDGACRACGRTGTLQCAHLVSREYKLTRYSRPNAVALCAVHHWRFTAHPAEWWSWCNARWPGRIERLEFLGRMGVRRKYHPEYGAAIRNYSKGGKKDETTSRW